MPRGFLDARGESGLMPKAFMEEDAFDFFVVAGKTRDGLAGLISAAVVNKDDFIIIFTWDLFFDFGNKFWDIFFFV